MSNSDSILKGEPGFRFKDWLIKRLAFISTLAAFCAPVYPVTPFTYLWLSVAPYFLASSMAFVDDHPVGNIDALWDSSNAPRRRIASSIGLSWLISRSRKGRKRCYPALPRTKRCRQTAHGNNPSQSCRRCQHGTVPRWHSPDNPIPATDIAPAPVMLRAFFLWAILGFSGIILGSEHYVDIKYLPAWTIITSISAPCLPESSRHGKIS